jgi:hypothetical protein
MGTVGQSAISCGQSFQKLYNGGVERVARHTTRHVRKLTLDDNQRFLNKVMTVFLAAIVAVIAVPLALLSATASCTWSFLTCRLAPNSALRTPPVAPSTAVQSAATSQTRSGPAFASSAEATEAMLDAVEHSLNAVREASTRTDAATVVIERELSETSSEVSNSDAAELPQAGDSFPLPAEPATPSDAELHAVFDAASSAGGASAVAAADGAASPKEAPVVASSAGGAAATADIGAAAAAPAGWFSGLPRFLWAREPNPLAWVSTPDREKLLDHIQQMQASGEEQIFEIPRFQSLMAEGYLRKNGEWDLAKLKGITKSDVARLCIQINGERVTTFSRVCEVLGLDEGFFQQGKISRSALREGQHEALCLMALLSQMSSLKLCEAVGLPLVNNVAGLVMTMPIKVLLGEDGRILKYPSRIRVQGSPSAAEVLIEQDMLFRALPMRPEDEEPDLPKYPMLLTARLNSIDGPASITWKFVL